MNQTEKLNILIVDDRPEDLLALGNLLESPDLNIVMATSGKQALGLMLKYDFALALLDVHMRDMDGYEVAKLMRGSERTKHIPIIFITAISKDQKHVFKSNESGAVDYLFKPLEPDILQDQVNIFLELHKQRKSLERTSEELKLTVGELKKANQKIIEQQKALIEEERLKVLLQMTGATAHELNQPLMVLLGNLDLMKMNKDNPEQLARHMNRIEQSGTRIADIVKKIQTIRHYETKPYLGESSIINIDQKITLLSVEDSDDDYELIRAIYDDHNQVELSRARNIKEAIQILQQQQFDLILLDYVLPDGNGFDFLRRKAEAGLETPVVIITGQGDEMIASQFIKEGAYDYLTKDWLSEKSLSRAIMNALEKARLKRDVKEVQNKMAEMSIRDDLTGAYNRRYFMEALEREVSKATRYGNELVLCMLDLDHFKEVNDTYGHPAGDMVLREIGKMLKECVRQSDLICRYGGEEFAVILPSTQLEKARIVCERFRGIVKQHQFQYSSYHINITVSIGVAPFNHSIPESLNDFIAKADEALYQAKAEGRNRVVDNLGLIQ